MPWKPIHADPGASGSAVIVEPVDESTPPAADATTSEREFQGDDLPGVLRLLARDAKISLVVGDNVEGTVTMRLEDKTPLEGIKIIAMAKGLSFKQVDDVYYVSSKEQPKPVAEPLNPPPIEPPTPSNAGSLANFLSPEMTGTLTKYCDSMLDYLARPETAHKIAKAKKELYDALITEGFTKDQAFKIILANQEIGPPSSK